MTTPTPGNKEEFPTFVISYEDDDGIVRSLKVHTTADLTRVHYEPRGLADPFPWVGEKEGYRCGWEHLITLGVKPTEWFDWLDLPKQKGQTA